MTRDPINYIAKDGERLDQIIYRHYDIKPAELSTVLEFIYNSNPHLAAIKQPFKTGLTIYLPPLPLLVKSQGVNLWD